MESAGLLTRSYFRLADCPRRSLQQIKDRHTRVALKRIALHGGSAIRSAFDIYGGPAGFTMFGLMPPGKKMPEPREMPLAH